MDECANLVFVALMAGNTGDSASLSILSAIAHFAGNVDNHAADLCLCSCCQRIEKLSGLELVFTVFRSSEQITFYSCTVTLWKTKAKKHNGKTSTLIKLLEMT